MALGDTGGAPPGGGPTAPHRGADAAHLVGDERLPCGRMVSRVWEAARTGRADPHMADCPHCREAVEGLTVLDRTAAALRAERPSARTVADRVVRAVRAETRLGRMLPLDDPAQDLRIAETTAAKVLRRAADGVPGVRAASCRLTPHEGDGGASLAMTLAMTLDQPLPDRAAQVRRAVSDAARRDLGLAVGSIDLVIASVLKPMGSPAPASLSRNGGGR